CCPLGHCLLLVVSGLTAPGAVECIGAPKLEPIIAIGTFLHRYIAPECARGTRHHECLQGPGARYETAALRDPLDALEAFFVWARQPIQSVLGDFQAVSIVADEADGVGVQRIPGTGDRVERGHKRRPWLGSAGG